MRRRHTRKLDLVMDKVDNPYFTASHRESESNPRRVNAVKNIRESAVETLYARGKLDKAQKAAADKFRQLWEACGGTIAALDYGREPVDGGGRTDPLPERRANAGRELARCRSLLGKRLYDLVCRVCGQGHALSDLGADGRFKKTAADNLRDSLDDLASMWGIIRRPQRNRSEAVR